MELRCDGASYAYSWLGRYIYIHTHIYSVHMPSTYRRTSHPYPVDEAYTGTQCRDAVNRDTLKCVIILKLCSFRLHVILH